MPPSNEFNAQLNALTEEMREQNSLWRGLLRGIFYGVGFVIGTTVLAVLLIGFFLQVVGNFPGIAQIFNNGVSLIKTTH